jgi:hypothetical protein
MLVISSTTVQVPALGGLGLGVVVVGGGSVVVVVVVVVGVVVGSVVVVVNVVVLGVVVVVVVVLVVVGTSVVVEFQGTESPLTHPGENKIERENVHCIAMKNLHLLQYRGDGIISGNLSHTDVRWNSKRLGA